jgi:galactosamine-6-phosphate isomerase
MDLRIFEDKNELNAAAAGRIREVLTQKPDALLCLAAGESPLGIFKELIRMDLAGEIDFSQSYFVSLDEWIGLGVNHPGSCLNFLDRRLFSQVGIPTDHIYFFDGDSSDPEKECQRVDRFIASRSGIDFILLGVGMNGHLGLNEPGADPALYSHVMQVESITREVAQQKYFEELVEIEKGITLGIKHIMEAREVMVVITGPHKAGIARQVLREAMGPHLPATLVRDHAHVTFLLDKDAGALL